MSFVKMYEDEFLHGFKHMRSLRLAMRLAELRQLEHDLYVGIYGEEPPE